MEIPRHWRLKAQRYRLEGPTCPQCGQFIFPPRPVCTKCRCVARLTRAWNQSHKFQNKSLLIETVTSTTFVLDASLKYSKAVCAISLMQLQQLRGIVIMT